VGFLLCHSETENKELEKKEKKLQTLKKKFENISSEDKKKNL